MLNFTVGPVQSCERVRQIGSENVPYFRTAEFSDVMLENERLVKKFAGAPDGSRSVFITGSGTASMEAAVMNILTAKDRALVVDGGTFGHRFCELLAIHGVPFDRIALPYGRKLRSEDLAAFDGTHYTAFLVNKHETSTGVMYDMDLISSFCRAHELLLVVDAISTFLADSFDMAGTGADVMITGSQKALACPPGVSVVVLSPRALARVETNPCRCLYLDLKRALADQARGQTPFTPAVGTLLQIHARLADIDAQGGAASEVAKVGALARDFREKVKPFPFEICSESLSNAVTPLHPLTRGAYDIFLALKDEFGIWICPNGGELRDRIFRVGHIGCLTTEDNDRLIAAFGELKRRGFI